MSVCLTTASPAGGQSFQCFERSALVDRLASGYGERPAGRGVNSLGHVTEIFVSGAGSWTVVVTTPRGLSCITQHGEHWMTPPRQPARKGAAS